MMQAIQPWYWRSLPLEHRTGSEVFAALFLKSGEIATLLESPSPKDEILDASSFKNARYSICAGVPRILNGKPQLWTPPVGEILPFLRRLLSSPTPIGHSPSNLPFTGGWLGWLGYDLAWEIEQLPKLRSDTLPFPVAYWYEPESFAVLDFWEQTLWLAATESVQLDLLQRRLEEGSRGKGGKGKGKREKGKGEGEKGKGEREGEKGKGEGEKGKGEGEKGKGEGEKGKGEIQFFNSSIAQSPVTSHQSRVPSPQSRVPSPHFFSSKTDYEQAVWQAKKYIKAGDIFQANLSVRFEAQTTAQSWAIYRSLQQINPSPFASYWQTPWGAVISCSPERLVQLRDRTCQTRPIAGTRPRHPNPIQDRKQASDLLSNRKENAEHIMLVDLERNDLGRVCEWGSVEVDELLTIERYSHVMHLVSNVKGTLRSDCHTLDLIRALFPGGTITGCPKVRCMEIVEELEPLRRNLFYGSCGYLDQRGNLDLNILIRTLLFANRNNSASATTQNIVWGQVGAGIVADSDPEKEWYESLDKAKAQLAALHQAEMPIREKDSNYPD